MRYFPVLLLGTALLLILPRPAAASVEEIGARLKNCRDITSMLTRVQCYDRAVDDFNLKTLEETAVGDTPGKWKVAFEESPINGKQNVYLSLPANEYIMNPAGKFIRPSIVLRCMEGKTEGYTVWNQPLGLKEIPVTTRIGEQDAVESQWLLSLDKEGAFIPDPQKLALQMIGQKTFFIKVWPNGANPLQAVFDIRGLETAAQALSKACHWPGITPPAAGTAPAVPQPDAPTPVSPTPPVAPSAPAPAAPAQAPAQ